MVQRILKAQATVTANTSDVVLDEFSPRSGKSYEVLELWTDGGASREFSVSVSERKLVDALEGEHAPTRDERLVYSVRVQEGDVLTVLASNTDAADAEITLYLLVDER